MKVNDIEIPEDLKYNDKYVWARVEGDIATIGLTQFGAVNIKEITFIELPATGANVAKGDKIASIETIKWSGIITAPISGEIIEVNQSLFDEPSAINRDPYGRGWICKIRMSNSQELTDLMDASKAAQWVIEHMQ